MLGHYILNGFSLHSNYIQLYIFSKDLFRPTYMSPIHHVKITIPFYMIRLIAFLTLNIKLKVNRRKSARLNHEANFKSL